MNRRKNDRKTGYRIISKVQIILFFIFVFSCVLFASDFKPLKVRGDLDYPPFEYLNESGKPEGFNIDVFRAVADTMGLEYDISLGTWDHVRNEIETGQVDVLLGMYRSEEREKMVDFSIPHFITTYAVFVKNGSEIKSLEDAHNKTIGVQKGDIGYDYLIENNITNDLYSADTIREVLEALSADKIECAFISRLQGLMILKEAEIKDIHPVGEPALQRKYCFAVTEDNDYILSVLNEGLSIIKTSGVYDEIYDKWFGVYENNYQQQIIRYVIFVAIPVLIIMALIILWNRSLKRQVDKRTEDLKKSETRIRTLSNNLHNGYIYQIVGEIDSQKRAFIYLSDGVEMLHGIPAKNILEDASLLYAQIDPEDARKLSELENNALKYLHKFSAEVKFNTTDGTKRWLLLSASPRKLNTSLIVWDGVVIDITERKLMEEELKSAKEMAEESNKIKTEFLNNMSHELRTPLNGIIGFSQILNETNLNASQKDYLDIIINSGKHLLDLIKDVLDLAKIESKKLELIPEKFNLMQLLRTSLQIIQIPAEKKGLFIHLSMDDNIPEYVVNDSQALRQILLNLLSNAVKFTEKGKITLAVSLLAQDKKTITLHFSISDTGIGIHQKNLKKITEAFNQEDYSITRQYGGTGLGLTITEKLLDKMNSSLEIESVKGAGSTFSFDLCLPYEDDTQKYPDSQRFKSEKIEIFAFLEGKKILIVEDDIPSMKLAEALLLKTNNQVKVLKAYSGRKVLDIFEKEAPDLIFMDLNLPDTNGYILTQQIRQLDTKIPIIALTANALNQEKERCLSVGMNQYLSKPLSFEAFRNVLKEWLDG